MSTEPQKEGADAIDIGEGLLSTGKPGTACSRHKERRYVYDVSISEWRKTLSIST